MRSRLFLSAFLLVLTGYCVLQSCKPRTKTPVIGLLMDKFNVERWSKDTTFFIENVKKLGGEVICKVANGDANLQLSQAKELIDKKVDILVILPVDLKKAADIVALANKTAIGVISYDRLIQEAYIDYYISFDNVKVGELQAEYIENRLQKGNIALIGGASSDQNSFYLQCGQKGFLQPYIERGDIKVVYDKMVSDWTFEEGYKAAIECLKNNKVDAIIAGNDLLARGAIKALEEKGLSGKVLVAGQDADSQACENIIKGLQTMSVYKSIEDIAAKAAQMAMDMARGNPINYATYTVNNGFKLVPSVLITPTTVNKGNIGLEINMAKK
ncbi:MAG: substrate-binding domain-containing protein [Bacteroidetes bacterium]|nr:substrate-binding domain-containing protein [Bacteroidota bacterium]